MAFGVLLMADLEEERKIVDDKVKQILPLLDGISYGHIEYILDKVKKDATLFPVKIELPVQ
jgi:hypothetical protein